MPRLTKCSRARVARPLTVLFLGVALLGATGILPAGATSTDIAGPTGSGTFGSTVKTLPNGNLVVVDGSYAGGGTNRGRVYLYSGATHEPISTTTGAQDGDQIGSGGVTVLNDGNFVVRSPKWSNGATANAGAATWCSATTGCPETIAVSNSLVGSHADDAVSGWGVRAMAGGAYRVQSHSWDNYKGAVTFCSDSAACANQVVSSANSLVGTVSDGVSPALGDRLGTSVSDLPNGGYVISSSYWNGGSGPGKNHGAVLGCPSSGCTGEISTTNALYGTTDGDSVGATIIVLPNSAYIVLSGYWRNAGVIDAGAATYCASVNDPNCKGQPVSTTNSLVGSTRSDFVNWATVLTNGDYVVGTTSWHNASSVSVGAATYCKVTAGVSACAGQTITPANSLTGSAAGDYTGAGIVALPGGKYILSDGLWGSYRGAITYCGVDGAGCTGQVVSSSNSLVGIKTDTSGGNGTTDGDQVGRGGVYVLADGSYLVSAPWLDVNDLDKVGAVIHCPASGCTGEVSTTNSLVGSQAMDQVGDGGIVVMPSGAFVVPSPHWANGATPLAGAVTHCANESACDGLVVSASNSMVGNAEHEEVGLVYGTQKFSNESYVFSSYYGGYDAANDWAPGALTYCPPSGCTGVVSAANSLVGSHPDDMVGYWSSLEEVGDGLYVVGNYGWQDGDTIIAGAMTLCPLSGGCTGPVTPSNSLIGGVANGGLTMNYSYDTFNHKLAVGRPAENLVTYFSLGPDKASATASVVSSSPANTSTYGASVTLSATVVQVSGIVTPTGSVTFKDGATSLCSAVALANGSSTCQTQNLSAGSHPSITAVYSGDANFNAATSPAITQTVNKTTLTVTGNNKSRAYGAVDPTFDASIGGFVNGESLGTSGVTGTANCTTSATASSPVSGSPYGITCSLGSLAAANYGFSFAPGNLTVTKATLQVAANSTARSYGADNPAMSATLSGFANGQTLATSGVTGSANCTTTAVKASPVSGSPYPIACTAGDLAATNYDFGYVAGSLTVTKAALRVTANDTSRYYGAANPTFGATFSGFVNGENETAAAITGTLSYTTTATITSTVSGGPYRIYPAGTLSAANYRFDLVTGILTIDKAALTVTANNKSRGYGATEPSFDASMSGYVNGENQSTAGVTGAPSCTTSTSPGSSVAGSPYPITCTEGSLASSNYQFSFVPGALNVTKATLSVTANYTRTYGTANPTLNANITGFANGQSLATSGVTGSASCTTAAVNTSPVSGSPYPITCTAGDLAAANYDFTYLAGSLTVSKAALSVTTNNTSRSYGEDNPGFSATVTGYVNGEDATSAGITGTPAFTTTATASSAASATPYRIYPVGGLSAANYSFAYVSGNLTIDRATLTVTANNNSRVYGAVEPSFDAAISGYVNGENQSTAGVTGAPSCTTTAGPSSAVAGSPYPIACAEGSLSSTNYQFTFVPGNLTVTKATLSVTANITRTYGSDNPSLDASITGFANGQSLATSGVTGSANCTTAAVKSSPVSGSPYLVTCTAGDLAAANYDFTYLAGRLTVSRAALSVTALDKSRLYGQDNPAFGATVTGFVNNEDSTSAGITGTPAFTTTATSSSSVSGSPYRIYPSGAFTAANYDFRFVPGNLTVDKAELTVTARNKSRSYGASEPAFDASIAGYVNGESQATAGVSGDPSCSTPATASSDVAGSPYSISCTPGTLASANYDFSFTPGELTITKANLSVTANYTRTYGMNNPTLTATITGFANGESLITSGLTGSATCTTTATAASLVAGSPYPITCSPGSLSAANYDFSYAAGSLTVTKAILSVTANDKSRLYGQSNPTFDATTSGFVNGETESTAGVSGVPDCTCPASPTSPVAGSPYPITCVAGTLAAANYGFTFVPGRLTVGGLAATLTIGKLEQTYDRLPKPITVTTTPAGLATTVVYSGTQWTTWAPTTLAPTMPGRYAVAATISEPNYQSATITGTLVIWLRFHIPFVISPATR
jgi:hypothetical protein